MKRKKYAVISLKHMNEKGIRKIIEVLSKMRYIMNEDYRINHYSTHQEMAIMNKRLMKDLKLLSTFDIKEQKD